MFYKDLPIEISKFHAEKEGEDPKAVETYYVSASNTELQEHSIFDAIPVINEKTITIGFKAGSDIATPASSYEFNLYVSK